MMKKKFWFGEWHSTYTSCNRLYKKLIADIEWRDPNNTGKRGELFVFDDEKQSWFNYVYDNYLVDDNNYLKFNRLHRKPKKWGIRNFSQTGSNYPLSYAPFNSNQFLPINRKHVFTCFADQDAVCKAKLRQKINSSYVKFKLTKEFSEDNNYVCNYCGAEGNDDNPLHLDHINPTFNQIYEEYKMRYGKLTLLAGNYGVFSNFHNKRADFQLLCADPCHFIKTREDRRMKAHG